MSFKQFLLELKADTNLFIDMDGVICDWASAAKAITGRTYGNTFVPNLERRRIFSECYELTEGMNFWANMPWTKGGQKLWASITHLNPYILSAYDPLDAFSKQGKYIWCQNNLRIPKQRIILVPSSKGKPAYAGPGKILVDDFAHNVHAWQQAGGIGIQHYDAEHTLSQLRDTLPSWNK